MFSSQNCGLRSRIGLIPTWPSTPTWGLKLAVVVGLAFGAGSGAGAGAEGSIVPELKATGSEIEAQVVEDRDLLPDRLLKGIHDLIERVDLRAKVKVGMDSDELGLGAYWGRRLEPSYYRGNTSLVDEFGIRGHLDPEGLSKDIRGSYSAAVSCNLLKRPQREHERVGHVSGPRPWRPIRRTF